MWHAQTFQAALSARWQILLLLKHSKQIQNLSILTRSCIYPHQTSQRRLRRPSNYFEKSLSCECSPVILMSLNMYSLHMYLQLIILTESWGLCILLPIDSNHRSRLLGIG
ncbi:hypothetical protein HanPI659440_Chr08g0280431 [Helianthus annuus]|nr:hypothetical protein HanPI659440_Chr08g0280431 [Helianthus annuus]